MGCCYSRHQDEDVPPNIPKRATKNSHKRKAANKLISTDITLKSSSPTCCCFCYEDNEKDEEFDVQRPFLGFSRPRIKVVLGVALRHPTSLIISASDPIQFVDFTDRDEEAKPNINIVPDAPPPPVLPL